MGDAGRFRLPGHRRTPGVRSAASFAACPAARSRPSASLGQVRV